MSKKQRSSNIFSTFAKLFFHKQEEYPAALDGRLTPWISASKERQKSLKKLHSDKKDWQAVSRGKPLAKRQKKTLNAQSLKLSPLEVQLKKMRLYLILKNSRAPKKITTKQIKARPLSSYAVNRPELTLRPKTKILATT